MLSAPNITVEDIEKFEPKAIKPIKELLPLKGLKVQLEWGKVYGKTEKDEDEMRFIYRIQMTDGAFIKGVNAESGEVMKYNFPILRKEDLEQPLEFDAVIPTISRGKGKYLVRKGDL